MKTLRQIESKEMDLMEAGTPYDFKGFYRAKRHALDTELDRTEATRRHNKNILKLRQEDDSI